MFSDSFNKVPYSISGDSFVSSAKDLSRQSTKNMIVVPAPNSLTNSAAVYSFPGLKLIKSGAAFEHDRGIHSRLFFGKGWQVSGGTLYSFDSLGNKTIEGSVSGTDLVSFADNGLILAIVAGNNLYQHDGTSLTTISVSFSPVKIVSINNQFIALDTNSKIWMSNVGELVFSGDNSLSSVSLPQNITSLEVYNQFVFFFGDSIEPWENTGEGNPPIERINGAIIEDVSLANRDAVTFTANSLYILGSDKLPYQIINFQARKLTQNNAGIAELFSGYDKSACFLQSAKIYGQDVVFFNFVSDKKVWVYSEDTQLWFELDHNINGDHYLGKTYANLYGKWFSGDRQSGNLYELDVNTYRDNSVAKRRSRFFRPFAGESVGSPRAAMQMRCIQFAVETGVGSSDDNPQMIAKLYFDGARTPSNERWISLGQEGDYQERVETYSNRKFKDLAVELIYTENTRFTLYDAAIYVREAGR